MPSRPCFRVSAVQMFHPDFAFFFFITLENESRPIHDQKIPCLSAKPQYLGKVLRGGGVDANQGRTTQQIQGNRGPVTGGSTERDLDWD